MHRRLAALSALLVVPLAASLAPVSTASAASGADTAAASGSLLYVKGDRVWIARPDGSGARPFTKAAWHWSSPSSDDHGDVVVVGGADSGSDLYRFAPDGNLLGRTPTWGSYTTPNCPDMGPETARVSPDGTKIAYGIFECGGSAGGTYTAMWTPATSTNLSFPHQTLGQVDFWAPEWVDSSHFLVSHAGPRVTYDQTQWFVHSTADGDDVGHGWYEPAADPTESHGVISRDGTTLAALNRYDDGKVDLWVYSAPSLGTAEQQGWPQHCVIQLDGNRSSDIHDASPSLAPDGSAIYWADDAGVEMADLTDRSAGCGGAQPTLVVPGGQQPFLSRGAIGTPDPSPIQPGLHPTPQVSVAVLTQHPTVGHPVAFAARAHVDGGTITGYRWRFGDGGRATGMKVKHAYKKAGTYQLTLVVTDSFGDTAPVTKRLRVARR